MTAIPAANISGALGGTDFGQRLSLSEQEQFQASADLYDTATNAQYLEVYMYHAAIERKRETDDPRPIPDASWTIMYKTLIGKRSQINWGDDPYPEAAVSAATSEKATDSAASDNEKEQEQPRVGSLSRENGEPVRVTQDERDRLYRALRVASWQAVFYLITTDILGWSAAGYTFQNMGFAAGVLTYFFFYVLAVFAGQVIWKLYLNLDSSKYPVTCYADLGERMFGRTVRHIFNVFQSFQLLFNVALLINGNGQTLAALAKDRKSACFIGLCAAWMGVGMIGGQIRSLRNFSWFANCNVWLNLASMIMTIYGCAHYLPVPGRSYHTNLSQPVITTGWLPPYVVKSWYKQVSGVQLAVFAYGGAMIFPEFMAEMRRPRDFWKAAALAQFFCFFCYMLFGLIVYSYQGQYTSILPALDFQNYPLILANNIITLFTTMIACILYGNIGVKVFYENVLRTYFKAPSMLTGTGRIIFALTVVVYYTLGWIIAVAIPFLSSLETLVGTLFILHFTYTFPPLLCCGFWVALDAMKGDRPWEPGMTPGSNRVDTWKDKSRWARGFKRFWYVKAFLLLLFLSALGNCGVGLYSAVETAITAFKGGFGKAFSCTAPA